MIDVSKPNFNKQEPKRTFVRKQRPIIGQVTLYKKKEMDAKDAWGLIIKTVNDKGVIDEEGAAVFIPMSELKDLLEGRFWNAAAYVFEAQKQQ